MKHMTFEEWSKANPDVDLDCDECNGEGTHTCSCGNEHDCHNCLGTGSQKRKLYLAQLARDKALIQQAVNSGVDGDLGQRAV